MSLDFLATPHSLRKRANRWRPSQLFTVVDRSSPFFCSSIWLYCCCWNARRPIWVAIEFWVDWSWVLLMRGRWKCRTRLRMLCMMGSQGARRKVKRFNTKCVPFVDTVKFTWKKRWSAVQSTARLYVKFEDREFQSRSGVWLSWRVQGGDSLYPECLSVDISCWVRPHFHEAPVTSKSGCDCWC